MDYDVIVVGAGFAGATAARELATRGFRVLILEGDDQIGGRTRTASLSDGELIELGGTYVHWLQPHTWSEITRYGRAGDLVPGGEAPEWALTPHADGLAWVPAAEHVDRERTLLEAFFADSRAIVPNPFRPRAEHTDSLVVADRLDELGWQGDDRDLVEAYFTTHTVDPAARASYLNEVRWWAPSGHDYENMEESVFGYKLRSGTGALLTAMLADGGASLLVSTPVTAISAADDGVVVEAASGQSWRAATAVVATPSGVWPHLRFDPPLAPERLAAAREGMQAPGGSKGFVVVRGEPRRIYCQPRVGHPFGCLWTSHLRPDGSHVLIFFGTPALKDADDFDEVAAAVHTLLPDTEVVEVAGRNFSPDDPLLRGAWPVLKPGQLTHYQPHLNFPGPDGPIAFATADIAAGWPGFIDGAIESGLTAARLLRPLLDARKDLP